MNPLAKLALVSALAALAAPSAAQANVIHFKGKATGPVAAKHMVVTFDVTASKGRATRISNIYVTAADFGCQMGGRFERNVRMFASGPIARNGEFDVRETQLPPGAKNWLMGRVILPKTLKNGKRTKLTVKGFFSAEFGFGRTRSEYNCIAADDFIATRV